MRLVFGPLLFWDTKTHTIIMLLQATGDVYNPTAGDIALMLASATIFFLILFWRRLAPGKWRSKLVTDHIKKAWFMLGTEEQKNAFTKLIVEAAKSDGKVTGTKTRPFSKKSPCRTRKRRKR